MEERGPESLPLEWALWGASPWQALRDQTLKVVDLLEELHAPLLALGVDGETVLVEAWPSRKDLEAHSRFPGMPRLSPEEVLVELLDRLERRYRDAQLVELFAQWPDPAGVWVLSRQGNTKRKLVAHASRDSISGGTKVALEA